MRTVYFDIDTQLDFVAPAGALYAPGAERIVSRVAALNRHAVASGSVVVSTVEAHREADPEFEAWPGHCIAGTLGQQKAGGTLLTGAVRIPLEPVELPVIVPGQVLLEKRKLDCFTNPNLPALLDALQAERYVVYGVVTEYCVRFAAMGLLKTGRPVAIVEDAVRSLDAAAAGAMFAEFESQGGTRTRADQVLSS